MGVKNLWRLLLPTGHRLSIETLSHQTLAIDASIWFAQISNACRDPETGRLLPNRPHVRIFLIRLMRLLFHQIKPVVVFDGPMPEVKRREIQRRKHRRERLWRDDDDGDEDGGGTSGGGALRRTAKKILVKQLKEWREKEAKLNREKKKGGKAVNNGNVDVADDVGEEKKEEGNAVRSQTSNNGGFAAGFILEDDDDDDENDETSDNINSTPEGAAPSPKSIKQASTLSIGKRDDKDDQDVISINSKDSKEQAKQRFQSDLNHFQQEHITEAAAAKNNGGDDNGYSDDDNDGRESENDWEMSHAVQSSLLEQSPSSKTKAAGDDDDAPFFDHLHTTTATSTATNETIASLPPMARHEWIDTQWKQRRIQSRKECLQAAADPNEYSSTQLRNFLKGTKLTKRVSEIGKLVEDGKTESMDGGQVDGGSRGCGGFAVAGSSNNDAERAPRTTLQRLRRHNNNEQYSIDDDEDDHEMFNSGTAVPVKMKVLFGDDDSDSDGGGGGGGFLLPSSSNPSSGGPTQKTSEMRKNEVVLLDDDSASNDSTDNDIEGVSANSMGTSHNPNNKCIQENTKDTTSTSENIKSNSTNSGSTFQPSKFLELSMAGQAWEEWGGDCGSNGDAMDLDIETNRHTNFNIASKSAKDAALPASSESESDEDDSDGQDGTFLLLGKATKCADVISNAGKGAAKNDFLELNKKDANLQEAGDTKGDDSDDDVDWEDGNSESSLVAGEVNSCQDGALPKIGQATKYADVTSSPLMKEIDKKTYVEPNKIDALIASEGDDDDDVEWEDGESDVNPLAEEAESGNMDETKNKANGQGDFMSRNDIHVEKEDSSGLTDIPTTEALASDGNLPSQDNEDYSEEVTNKKSVHMDDKHDIVKIPPNDDTPAERESDRPKHNNSEKELLTIDSSDDSQSENEFDAFTPNNPQVAAFKHAQETASRLTSWAGRAFQRAISAHVGEQSMSDSPNGKGVKTDKIDLAVTDEVIDVDAVSNIGTSTEAKDNVQDSGEQDSPRQRDQKMPELFDTSLEGLNEAHQTILEEEKAMERDMDMTITDEMKEDILTLLQLCGIPWIESPSEAEAQCAALEELGLVSGIVTEDSDVFVFGGKKVYKNFFNEQKYVEAYYAKDIERELALKKHQFVALAMLLGGDYTDGVKGVGIVNGMEILQAFTVNDTAEGVSDSLSRFREWLDGFGDPSIDNDDEASRREALFHKKHKSARTRWSVPADFPSQAIINAYLKPAVDKSEAVFSWAKPDLKGLQQYCAETLGWEQEETDRIVNPVLKVLESGSKQTRIENYFMRYEDKIKFAEVRSKRLRSVLTDIQRSDKSNDDIESAVQNDVELGTYDNDDETKPKKKRQRKK